MKRIIQILTILVVVFIAAGCLKLDYEKETAEPEAEGLTDIDLPKEKPERAEKITTKQIKPENFTTKYNLPDEDLFSIGEWTSLDVSVMGIKLGDPKEKVVEVMGEPDSMRNYPELNISNLEYKQKLGLDSVGLLYNIQDNKVNRITFKIPMNKYLKGNTRITLKKDDFFRLFGQPSEIRLLSAFTVYAYYTRGLEILMDGPVQNGFSLTWPREEPEHIKNAKKTEVVE